MQLCEDVYDPGEGLMDIRFSLDLKKINKEQLGILEKLAKRKGFKWYNPTDRDVAYHYDERAWRNWYLWVWKVWGHGRLLHTMDYMREDVKDICFAKACIILAGL